MLIAITKDALLQNRTPQQRVDDNGYFKRAIARLEEALQATQRSGAKHLLIDGAFIESISTAQAFTVFGLIQRFPVKLIWSARNNVPGHIKESGICLFAELNCTLKVGNATIQQLEQGIEIGAFDSAITIPSAMIPQAVALDTHDAPGIIVAELARKGRAKYTKTSLEYVPLQDDRDFVRELNQVERTASTTVTHTEFVEKLQSHLASRRSSSPGADIKQAINERVAQLDIPTEIGDYLIKLEDDISMEIEREQA